MINALIVSLLGTIMIVMAFVAIYHKKIQVAVIAAGVISLIVSVVFLFLAAPDVAITEAAIGSALTTVIFFYVIQKINQTDDTE